MAPWWLLKLFPSLKGIEENPLYLRLSGRRFTKRRFLGPRIEELTAASPSIRIGIAPVVMIFGYPAFIYYTTEFPGEYLFLLGVIMIPLGLFLLANRLRGVAIAPLLFLRKAAGSPWGESLYFSHLTARDYNDALLASTVEKTVKRIPWACAIVPLAVAALVLLGLIFLFMDSAMTLDAVAYFKLLLRYVFPVVLLGGLEIVFLTAFFSAYCLQNASRFLMRRGVLSFLWVDLKGLLLGTALHLPGAVAAQAWLANRPYNIVDPEQLFIAYYGQLSIFAASLVICSYLGTRYYLSRLLKQNENPLTSLVAGD